MNTTAFILGLIFVLGYYGYIARKQRKQQKHKEEHNTPNKEEGDKP